MKKLTFTILMLIFAVYLSQAACGFAGPGPATPIPDAIYTAAAQTIVAEITRQAPAATTEIIFPVQPTQVIVEFTATPLPPSATSIPADSPTETAAPSPTSTATTVQPEPTEVDETLIFEDDFEVRRGWFLYDGDNFEMDYHEGGYRITVKIPNAPIWSIREKSMEDASFEVAGRLISGPNEGYYGFVCRHNEEDNYYALVASGDGSYGIGKNEAGEFEWLVQGKDTAGILKLGDGLNQLRAECIGETLVLYANGQELARTEDDDFSEGYFGLIAISRLGGSISALFDLIKVYEP